MSVNHLIDGKISGLIFMTEFNLIWSNLVYITLQH